MTPEQEIAGLKTLLNAWKADCQRYESGLKAVRSSAISREKESGGFAAIVEFIDGVLAHDEQCGVCGDHHEGDVPLTCASGDGV